MYNLGIGTEKNAPKTQELFKSACSDGLELACKAKQ